MEKSEKELLAAFAIETALKAGADEVAVNLTEDQGIGIQYRDGEIEQLVEASQNSLSVGLYCKNKYSGHSTNNLKRDALARFIENAVKATGYLTEDPFRQLPDPKHYPKDFNLNLNLFDDEFHNVKTEDRIEIVKKIYESARENGDKIISVAAGYSDSIFSSLKVHSNGFSGCTSGTLFSAGAEVTVKDNDSRPEDWFSVQNRFLSRFPGIESIGDRAAKGALNKIGQAKIKTGNYNMIVENRAAMPLISMLISPTFASTIQQKSSYLDGMIGNSVASDLLTINDNPFIQGALGSRLYDNEGIESRERIIINKGILKQYYIDNYYGKKLSMEPNGGSSSNLVFSYGNQTISEIMKDVGHGIFITGFNGGNSNSTTGDFSFGISGFLFENGQFVKPVNEMNISGNGKSFWPKLIGIANDPYPYSKWMAPSLLFEDIVFSGS